jgi:hypothetical protein
MLSALLAIMQSNAGHMIARIPTGVLIAEYSKHCHTAKVVPVIRRRNQCFHIACQSGKIMRPGRAAPAADALQACGLRHIVTE